MKTKIKNFIIGIFVVLVILLNLCGCSNNENNKDYKPTQGSMFICVEQYEDPYLEYVKILVDKNTRVMYIYYTTGRNNDNSTGGMTVIYDSDGKPKKYSGVITD